jgi:chromosome segregation ATPase
MFEGIRRKLSEAIDALGGDRPVSRDELDRVLGEMRQELIEARARLKEQQEEVGDYERRLEALRDRDDVSAAQLAEIEAEVKKRRAELDEHRRVVADLTEQFRDAMRQREVLPARDRRTRASETLRGAAEEGIRELERLEEEIERGDAERSARREVEEALDDAEPGRVGGRDDAVVDEEFRDAEADALLKELKRRMGMDPEGG